MTRPVFGPARQTLGHPATTRFLDQLWPDEVAEREQRERNEAAVKRHINEMLDRRDAEKAS